ncbi:hypothetical protein ACFQV4_01920 [Streptomyces thermocarboxydus]
MQHGVVEGAVACLPGGAECGRTGERVDGVADEQGDGGVACGAGFQFAYDRVAHGGRDGLADGGVACQRGDGADVASGVGEVVGGPGGEEGEG